MVPSSPGPLPSPDIWLPVAERLSGRFGAERGLSVSVGVIPDIVRGIGSEQARKGAQRFLDFLEQLDRMDRNFGMDPSSEFFGLNEIMAFLVFYDELDKHHRQVSHPEGAGNPKGEIMHTYSQAAITQLGLISLVLPFLVTELQGKHPQSLSVLSGYEIRKRLDAVRSIMELAEWVGFLSTSSYRDIKRELPGVAAVAVFKENGEEDEPVGLTLLRLLMHGGPRDISTALLALMLAVAGSGWGLKHEEVGMYIRKKVEAGGIDDESSFYMIIVREFQRIYSRMSDSTEVLTNIVKEVGELLSIFKRAEEEGESPKGPSERAKEVGGYRLSRTFTYLLFVLVPGLYPLQEYKRWFQREARDTGGRRDQQERLFKMEGFVKILGALDALFMSILGGAFSGQEIKKNKLRRAYYLGKRIVQYDSGSMSSNRYSTLPPLLRPLVNLYVHLPFIVERVKVLITAASILFPNGIEVEGGYQLSYQELRERLEAIEVSFEWGARLASHGYSDTELDFALSWCKRGDKDCLSINTGTDAKGKKGSNAEPGPSEAGHKQEPKPIRLGGISSAILFYFIERAISNALHYGKVLQAKVDAESEKKQKIKFNIIIKEERGFVYILVHSPNLAPVENSRILGGAPPEDLSFLQIDGKGDKPHRGLYMDTGVTRVIQDGRNQRNESEDFAKTDRGNMFHGGVTRRLAELLGKQGKFFAVVLSGADLNNVFKNLNLSGWGTGNTTLFVFPVGKGDKS